jgi:hypothetical protein
MLDGFYRSTFEPNNTTRQPFAADAIISNPPAFAHVHIAEALGLPLLMSFSESGSLDPRYAQSVPSSHRANSESSHAVESDDVLQASARQHQELERRERAHELPHIRPRRHAVSCP